MPDFEPDVEMDETDLPDDSDSPEDQDTDTPDEDVDETPTDEDDTDDVEDEDIEDDEESKAPVQGRSPAFEKLLAKYNGDYGKMADAYFEQANSSSRLYHELQELKALVSKQQEDPKKAEEFVKNDPYVKEIQEEAASVQQEVNRISQEQYQLIATYGQAEKDAIRLEGELKRADEVDGATIRAELSEKRATLKDALREFNANKRELGSLTRTLRGYDRQLRSAEAQARARMDNENKAKQTAEETGRIAGRDFEAAMVEQAEAYGVDPSSQKFKFVRTIIKDRLINHMTQMDPNSPAIDMGEAVEYLMGEAAENLGLKAGFQKVSNLKARTTTPKRNARPRVDSDGKRKPPTDKTGKYWSPEYIDRRAKRLLGG